MAVIKAIIQGSCGYKLSKDYDEDRIPQSTMFCVGYRVSLVGVNIKPEWGFYHGSIFTILDIVYEHKERAHYRGSEKEKQPMYVQVDFPQYCGPSFYDSKNTELKSERDTKRTWAPVPSVLGRFSNNGACAKLYMSLSLTFGKTIHSFQGASVGKTAPGRPDNAFERKWKIQEQGILNLSIPAFSTLFY